MQQPLTRSSHSDSGLRVVAAFEAFKGVLVVVAGFGLLASIDAGAARTADALVRHLHLNPARHLPHVFLDAAAQVSNSQLLGYAALAMTYALVRFAEAYGLWRQRPWAEWLAALSGGIYLPYEVIELVHRVTPLKICTFTANLGIVAFMAWRLWSRRRSASLV